MFIQKNSQQYPGKNVLLWLVLLFPLSQFAQAQDAEEAEQLSPQEASPIDLTGTWVSIISEAWRWRMVTPAKGDFAGVPLSQTGFDTGMTWDPEADEDLCIAYGAPRLMHEPGRTRISWQDNETLKIEFDSGMQTRLLHFNSSLDDVPEERSLHGYSLAEWVDVAEGFIGDPDNNGEQEIGPVNGTLKVVTTNLDAGYLRKNGVPYSEETSLTEYWNINHLSTGPWLTITTEVVDPINLSIPYITSPHFRKEDDDSGWDPRPCSL